MWSRDQHRSSRSEIRQAAEALRRTSIGSALMSAIGGKADIRAHPRDVCYLVRMEGYWNAAAFRQALA
jgi:hypothetical protein